MTDFTIGFDRTDGTLVLAVAGGADMPTCERFATAIGSGQNIELIVDFGLVAFGEQVRLGAHSPEHGLGSLN